MLVHTAGLDFRKARSVNATNSSFVSMLATVTEPAGDSADATGHCVFNLVGNDGTLGENGMVIMPYSTGSNNDTYSVRVYGWRKIGGATAALKALWRPCLLVELGLVASSTEVGIAGSVVLNTEMFADTMTLTTGNDDISVDIVSPTGDVAAHAMLDLKGFQKLEITFKTGTTPTDLNAIWALL